MESVVNHSEGSFRTSRSCVLSYFGIRAEPCDLYYQRWTPAGLPPRGVVVVVHGFGEHSGRYAPLAEFYAKAGYAVYSCDQRGAGRSTGIRGHVDDWADYREDLSDFLRLVREKEPQAPLFLYGHSLGGLEVLDYAEHYGDRCGLSGVISSAAALEKAQVKPYLFTLSKILSKVPVLGSRLKVDTHLDPSLLSHDAAVVNAYRNDPFVHGFATPAFGQAYEKTRKETMDGAGKWTLPLLVVYPTEDRINPPAGSLDFFNRVPAGNKTSIAYEGSYHEIHNEIPSIREKLYADTQAWLDRRTSQ